MSYDKVLSELEKKAKLYDEVKERGMAKVSENFIKMMDKLKEVEKEVLNQMERAYGENPYMTLLCKLNSGEKHKSKYIKSFLNEKIPQDFGPNEGLFSSLSREIDSLKKWNEVDEDEEDEEDEDDEDVEYCPEYTPKNIICNDSTYTKVVISWNKVSCGCVYEIELRGNNFVKRYSSVEKEYAFPELQPLAKYYVQIRTTVTRSNIRSPWSEPVAIQTKWPSAWKRCPGRVDLEKAYYVDGKNHRIARKLCGFKDSCTVIGRTLLPFYSVISWNIKIIKSKDCNGGGIFVGIAPSDINQNGDHNASCGWYYHCFTSTLRSGPPHNYYNKKYGPREEDGGYVYTGDTVGVVMDTTNGELSFVLHEMNLGTAYKGIPLDKPLVPCVILTFGGDSIELEYT